MFSRLASLIVDHRRAVVALLAVLTAATALLLPRVGIITDQREFLPDDSQMRVGMRVMEQEWGAEEPTASVRVMVTGPATEADRAAVADQLAAIDGVRAVDFAEDEHHVTQVNGATASLYVLSIDGDYDSDAYARVTAALEAQETNGLVWSTDNPSNASQVPLWILVVAVALAAVILVLMCASWIEPLLFLVTIGVAVIINMGTNLIQGQISDVSSSIAGILQMVLSMDYSIILANRYRQERQAQRAAGTDVEAGATVTAMKTALAKAFTAVSSASLTTFVGLLMLTLMSFRIGQDVGIVLAKGVLISLLCVLTLLPALLIWCDGLIARTAKPFVEPRLGGLARAEHRGRWAIAAVFVVLLVGVGLAQGQVTTAFTLNRDDAVADVFAKDNQVVLVYANDDEVAATALGEQIAADYADQVRSVQGYGTTLGAQLTAEQMQAALTAQAGRSDGGQVGRSDEAPVLDPQSLALIYYRYHGGETGTMSINDLAAYVSETQATQAGGQASPSVLSEQDAAALAGLSQLGDAAAAGLIDPALLSAELTPEEMAATLTQIRVSQAQAEAAQQGVVLDEASAAAVAGPGVDATTLEMLYLNRAAATSSDPSWTMSTDELLTYVSSSVLTDAAYASLVSEEQAAALTTAKARADQARAELIGPTHSRMVITTGLPEDSPETTAFIEDLTSRADDALAGPHWSVGSSVMVWELQSGFAAENLRIALLTALAIFIIVALTFRSLAVPAVLVLLVECGVLVTVAASGLVAGSMYYLAMLVVQCILMGATIDYAIVLTTYYRQHRRTEGVVDSLTGAYDGAIHTILTSGLIMVLVTGVLGRLFENPTVGQICQTISIGALSAVLLIVFVLPALLAVSDRWVVAGRRAG
ncbi:MMPL family transporter [Actinomyces respiraculi]|uniref:MMPL family transporter n=1 Tax=Actinomyces respiraculi TaxID=2744574 RepID=UPI00141D9DD4|nr:MMPL family transporter [Actinomyces respiraculi]